MKNKLRGENPPILAEKILDITCRFDYREFVSGDLREFYYNIRDQQGKWKANAWYWKEAILSIPGFLINLFIWWGIMFKNFFKAAYRNIIKNKIFTGINILGLSVALSCTILIYLFIQDEYSFDKFHENADSIYIINNHDNYFNYDYRISPIALGPALKEFYPEIITSVRLSNQRVIVRNGSITFQERLKLTDPGFFSMFSFELIHGDAKTALEGENSIVLRKSIARKYFGDVNPLGKTLTASYGILDKEFIVTGVTEELPSNSTITFDFLININNIKIHRGPEAMDSWTWPMVNNYVQLKRDTEPGLIENRLPSFMEQYHGPGEQIRRNNGTWIEDRPTIEYSLMNLKDIYLYSSHIAGEPYSNPDRSLILGAIALIILIIASINFTNISIGRVSTRATEVGLRKVLGAQRSNLVFQFWCESMIIVFFAMILGVFLSGILLPLFNAISEKSIEFTRIVSIPNLILFLGSVVILGIFAGSFPALVLSRFQPVEIMKGTAKLGGKNLLTKTLVIVQLTSSIFLLVSTMVMNDQLNFIDNKDLGYDQKGVVQIHSTSRDYNTNERVYNHFLSKSENYDHILDISGCSMPFSQYGGEGMWQLNGHKRHFNFNRVYYNFVKTLGMSLVAGRDFSPEILSDSSAIVVNEEFVRQFEIEDPIGYPISSRDPNTKIIGVVKDYNYSTLQHKIEPVMHWLDREFGPRILLVKISSNNIAGTLEDLEMIWDEIQPQNPFVYTFFDEDIAERYKEEKRWSDIVLISSLFALFITCIGLIGITSITISRKIKEIGVRKILGASISTICQLLVKDYLKLVIIANFIAWPLGYFIMEKWLQGYAYRTSIGLTIFIYAFLLSFCLSILTISIQVFKTAASNPVDSLRQE